MLAAVSLTALCTSGVAFYARFLFALYKECRHHGICCLVCLPAQSAEHAVPEGHALGASIRRAA